MNDFPPTLADDPRRLWRHAVYIHDCIKAHQECALNGTTLPQNILPASELSISFDLTIEKLSRLECRALFDAMQKTLPPELRELVYSFLVPPETFSFPTSTYDRTFPTFATSRVERFVPGSQPLRESWNDQLRGSISLPELVSYWYKHNTFIFHSPYVELMEFLRVKPFEGVSTKDVARNLRCVIHAMEVPQALKENSPDKEAQLSWLKAILRCPPGAAVCITTKRDEMAGGVRQHTQTPENDANTIQRVLPVLWTFVTKALAKDFVVSIDCSKGAFTPRVRNATPETWIAEFEKHVGRQRQASLNTSQADNGSVYVM